MTTWITTTFVKDWRRLVSWPNLYLHVIRSCIFAFRACSWKIIVNILVYYYKYIIILIYNYKIKDYNKIFITFNRIHILPRILPTKNIINFFTRQLHPRRIIFIFNWKSVNARFARKRGGIGGGGVDEEQATTERTEQEHISDSNEKNYRGLNFNITLSHIITCYLI